jgi:hypothetical protein
MAPMNLLEVPGRILVAPLRALLPGLSDLEKKPTVDIPTTRP